MAARHRARISDRRDARGRREIPTFLSYALEKRIAKKPAEFGHGAIEGVAGPEAANNASAAGTLMPLLSLGLPTTATAAIMLAGFQQYGLDPGPLLFATDPDLVWGLIASLFIADVMLLVLNLPLVGLWVRLLAIRGHGSMRAFSYSPRSARSAPIRRARSSCCSCCSACSGSECGASIIRSRR